MSWDARSAAGQPAGAGSAGDPLQVAAWVGSGLGEEVVDEVGMLQITGGLWLWTYCTRVASVRAATPGYCLVMVHHPRPRQSGVDRADHDSTVPFYRQVYDSLRKAIATGEIRPIPSKRALVQEHEVAPNTMQRAIEMLQDEGLLETVPGKGLYVKGPGR
jgi:GntR family transcriptional regulator